MSGRDDVLKAWWASLRREVGDVVNDLDPEGLVAMGAPSGEYSHEIDRLTSLVVHDEVIEESILAVWERAFGPENQLARRPDLLLDMTQRLLQLQEDQPRP